MTFSLENGRTLPAKWYTEQSIFDQEKKTIFNQTWQYVGRVDQVPEIGDFFACKLGEVPILIVRDEKKELKAFVNVCKHRGAEIVLEGQCGHKKTLQCHYHAWTWDLDGKLLAAPRSNEEKCFNKDDFSLNSLPLETFGPFIFVNPSKNALPWSTVLGTLPSIISETGFDLNKLKYRQRIVYEIKANWKIIVENFLECYHCPTAHKGFTNLIDLNEYHVIPYQWFSVQRGPVRESAKTKKSEKQFDVSVGATEGIYTFLWPNFMANTYPGPQNASTNIILPVAVDRTIAIYEFFVDEKIAEEEAVKIVNFIDEVQREDVIICESVQRGLSSGFYDQGRLILSKENGIQHFQQMVHSALS